MHKILLFVALVLALGWFAMRALRGKPEPPVRSTPVLPGEATTYHAVSLKYSNNACNAAKAMTGRRFLSSAAPRLPLAECDALECRCQFAHHSDRRSGEDRRGPFNPGVSDGGTGTLKIERRQLKDRRNSADPDAG